MTGYVFLVFEEERSVQALVAKCLNDDGRLVGFLSLVVSSRWVGDSSNHLNAGTICSYLPLRCGTSRCRCARGVYQTWTTCPFPLSRWTLDLLYSSEEYHVPREPVSSVRLGCCVLSSTKLDQFQMSWQRSCRRCMEMFAT